MTGNLGSDTQGALPDKAEMWSKASGLGQQETSGAWTRAPDARSRGFFLSRSLRSKKAKMKGER